MKRRILTLMLLLLTAAFVAEANPVDLRTAREVAVKFMNANSEVPLRGADDLRLVKTYNISRGDAAFYVFNTPNGFVIVSADDCATPILGYSNEGQFDVENIPIQLQDYLQDFVEQIQYGKENHIEDDDRTAQRWERVKTIGHLAEQRATSVVEPLLTDTWGQGCYYNNLCPENNNGPCGHCVTGCVATSMAQIMHYWSYPNNGMGSRTYTPGSYPEQSVDFGATTYDWANMPNRLSSSSTLAQINAVATLMWHCGVAVGMGYGAYASGVSSGNVTFALLDYFGYSEELEEIYREYYSDTEWLNLLINCLDLGRPVHYSGGNHAFVCDGYDADSLLHFNLGWNGVCNGYYAVDALNIGGGDYNEYNRAIINIHPWCNSGSFYQITATAAPSSYGSVSGAGTYCCGDGCTLTATANEGYGFMYWTENGEQVSFDASYSFIAVNDRDLVAHFEPPFSITASANPSEGGTAEGGGICYYNQTVALVATPNEGYVFDNWTKNGIVVSCLSTYNVSVTEAAEYVANFRQVDGIAIGEAACTNIFLPTSSHRFSMTQQIYTAEELNADACEISSVSFFNTYSSNTTRDITLYMVNTDKSTFESSTDWISVMEADQVFSGTVQIAAYDWTTIYFNTPFTYDGVSNVALIVDNNSNSYSSTLIWRTFETSENQAVYVWISGTDYDPYNPSGYEGSLLPMKNQVVFGFPSYDYNVTVAANPEEGGSVSGGGLYFYGQPLNLSATPNEGYVFNSWKMNDEVVSYLSSDIVPVTGTDYVANFQQMDGIIIGDALHTNQYLPTHSFYNSLTQQIYTAAEMGGVSHEISSVSFFNTENAKTRDLRIYMVHTDKTTFEGNSDWITVTEDDKVFSGSVAMNANGWTIINFSKVFNYDGTSNIALVVDDKSRIHNSGLSCRTFSTDEIQAIRVNGMFGFDPQNPTDYTGTLMSEKNQVVFGFPSYEYTVNVTVNPLEGGSVSGGDGMYYLGQSCTLTATANTGYCFYNWTENGTVVSSNATYSFPVSGNMNIVANFGEPIMVTATANPSEGGSVSGGGGYGYNHTCTLTATPNEGYVFVKWTKNGTAVSYLSNYSIRVTSDAEYVAHFQPMDGIVIGDAQAISDFLPTNSESLYCLSQQIYTAEELGVGACDISSVSFFNTGYGKTRNFTIYMANTDKTAFESEDDRISVTEANQVFSGNVALSGRNWTTIYFNTGFVYDGSSNVVLVIEDNTNSSSYGLHCREFETEDTQAIYYFEDPYEPESGVYGCSCAKNQVVFGIASYDYTVTVSANPVEGTVSGGGVCFNNQPITLTATPNEGYIFSNWTKDGEVVSYVSIYNVSVTESAEYVANFELKPDGIVIGDASYTNLYLPTYFYFNSLTQQIYTAEEMNTGACEISSVSFFNTGNFGSRSFTIYMLNTDKTAFDSSTDWITVTEADQVFSGSITMVAKNWTTIYFNTPFLYDGSSNVALVIDDNSNAYSSSISCRTFATDENQAIRINGSVTDYDPFNPSDYTGTLMSMKNQVIFGIETNTQVQQVFEFSAGWNWISLYVELGDPIEALQMLEEALGDNATVISASEMYTEYYGNGSWIGDLDEVGITNEQMYMVEVVNDCEIELEGTVANPVDHAITIYPGWNWIGFPSSEELNLEEALADFEAEEGDQLTEAELYTEYGFGMWIGDVATLVPGRGYMYFSNSTQPKTLVFRAGVKAKADSSLGKRKE